MSTKLGPMPVPLPCPFCGGKPSGWKKTRGRYEFGCHLANCIPNPTVLVWTDRRQAIEIWNDRVPRVRKPRKGRAA